MSDEIRVQRGDWVLVNGKVVRIEAIIDKTVYYGQPVIRWERNHCELGEVAEGASEPSFVEELEVYED
jgi:hypothetical protein